ncbi:TSUP family transporter [Rhodobacteraceae bacterium 2CG4]|uniref:Probable membrane transporter protein n=1 Tax=Halovulum marinum TaxID=2662447 RepID=A0A6L5Z0H9_9RHOB|nr:sulfite exporter TauE/SafE family protein [Halovulum marinum]MSU89582.1 TSUP family transporter [Halovulum marinum]
MDLTLTFFLATVPAVILSGISKGGFGSGAGFAATPLLALVLEPAQAVVLMLPLLMIMDATALRAWWGRWDRDSARLLILGGLAGIAAGAALFTMISDDLLRVLIGLIAVGFVAWQLLKSRLPAHLSQRRSGPVSGVFWGGVTGLTSFISHAGGPPASVFLLGRGLDKSAFQATTVIVFAVVNALKFFCYIALGLFGQSTALAVGLLAPVAVLGTLLGVWAHRFVPERAFFVTLYVLLTVAGARLIWVGLA